MLRVTALAAGVFAATLLHGTPAHADPQRILIYGDSNTWGYEARADGKPTHRLPVERRWTGILQKKLGRNFVVIEDGLNLRTTNLDGEDWPESPMRPDTVNGAKHLPTALAAHMPLDLVVIMLGTNDLQARYQRSPSQSAEAVIALAHTVQAASGGIGSSYQAPKVLIVSPVGMANIPIEEWRQRYAGGPEKSAGFASAYKKAADDAQIPVFDAAVAIGGAAHGADGVHLSEEDHQRLADGILPAIRQAIGARD